MKTDTPRTDNEAEHACNVALQYECRDIGSMTDPPMVVGAEFARQLERELARLQTAINEFCEKHSWADERWKAQPHIKALFDLKGKNQ